MKQLIKKYLPTPLTRLISKLIVQYQSLGGYYYTKLSEEEIQSEAYKERLGGGAENWEARGRFQLFLLKGRGLLKNSKVIDIGCGPGRAAKHLIAFLDPNNYYGMDYNGDFIDVAQAMVKANQLEAKQAVFEVVQNFDLSHLEPVFDYALVFSVLNHCNKKQRKAFFNNIDQALKRGAKVYLSHSKWFDPSYLVNTKMKQTGQLTAQDYPVTEFGWKKTSNTFPIIELTKF